MKCFLCRSDHGRPNSLIKHLKVIHGLCTGRTLHLKCGQEGCSRSFGSFSGFRKHLNKCHVSGSFDSVEEGDFSPHQSVECSATEVNLSSEHLEAESTVSSTHLVNSCASVISDLKAAGVGQSVLNSVVISMEETVQDIQQHAKETVIKHVFSDDRETETCKKVEACFEELENPFTILNSEYKRSKFLSGKWETVEPVECVIIQDKFMYFPILSTLELIFRSQYIAEMLKS